MELQETGRYRVEPFELERILELELRKKANEHASLRVRGVLKEGEEDRMVHEDWDERPIKLTEDGTPLFCGVALEVGTVCENGIWYLEAEAVSWTVKLDREMKKRSFQEHGLSYNSIVSQLAQEAAGTAKCNAPEKKVENLLLEYRETDWEFLKRLASHSGSVLVADAAASQPSFSFGVEEGKEYQDEAGEEGDFAVKKKVARYRRLSQEEFPFQETDAVEYTLKTDHATLDVGDMVRRKGQALYVREVCLRLIGSVSTCSYSLTTKAGLSTEKMCHPHISGLTLDGAVLKAEGDTVRVHLSIDKSQDVGTAYPFPYATGYTAEGHTGWYVMPEEGDTVQIVFPTEDENEAYAVQAVRRDDTEKTSDPRVKYLRTADGKEIKLDKDEILITANDNLTFVKINKNSGVEIITDKQVLVKSDGNITVTSGGAVSMSSAGDFSIHAGKNLSVTAADSATVTCRENSMKMECGSSGIEMSAAKPVKVTGGSTMDLTSSGKFTAKSSNEMQLMSDQKLEAMSQQTLEVKCQGNEMKLESGGKGVLVSSGKEISVTGQNKIGMTSMSEMSLSSAQNLKLAAGQKLSLAASSSLEESCSGSSIKLDGNINLKAALIKEN